MKTKTMKSKCININLTLEDLKTIVFDIVDAAIHEAGHGYILEHFGIKAKEEMYFEVNYDDSNKRKEGKLIVCGRSNRLTFPKAFSKYHEGVWAWGGAVAEYITEPRPSAYLNKVVASWHLSKLDGHIAEKYKGNRCLFKAAARILQPNIDRVLERAGNIIIAMQNEFSNCGENWIPSLEEGFWPNKDVMINIIDSDGTRIPFLSSAIDDGITLHKGSVERLFINAYATVEHINSLTIKDFLRE